MPLPGRPLSLASRLTLMYGMAAAIVFTVFGWIIIQSTERHFWEEDTSELEIIARAAQGVLTGLHAPHDATQLTQRFNDIVVGHHHAALYIADKDGRTIYASPGSDLSVLASAANPEGDARVIRQWSDRGHTYTTLIQRVHEPGPAAAESYTLVISVPIDVHLRFLASFRETLWLIIASCVAIMGLLGWVAVRRGHAPLHQIVAQIRRITAHELNTRLVPENVPNELTDLALSFNGMLQRMDEAFNRLSHFNADIAHELRTPITNLMTQTHVALSQARTIDEYREVLYSNMEEYERMAQMVGDMLFLAQTEHRPQIEHTDMLDLAKEVRALFEYYESWADERGVSLALSGDAMVAGSRLMFRRMLSNLLSNAIRYTPASGTVRVDLATTIDGGTTIAVENPGPPIPPEDIPRLFDRFFRVDRSRQRGDSGTGLGLAIVKSIVTAHRGKILVDSGHGATRFSILLPPPTPTP